MPQKNQYGQYCPLALSSQIVGSRWTMLIIRELLFGAHSFNDISKGVPRMSRTLLSNRLKEMVNCGLLEKSNNSEMQGQYHLTKAGHALAPIITDIARWGQEWLNTSPLLEDIDVDLLMWDIGRNAVFLDTLPKKFVVEFHLTDAPEGKKSHWLVFEDKEIEICIFDRGFDVDVFFEVDIKTLTQVWMGWKNFDEAKNQQKIILKGSKKHLDCAEIWLGKSALADVKRQPEHLQI